VKHSQFQIVWSPLAVARLQEIRAYIALDKTDAAERLSTRIVALVEALRTNPHLGRIGPEAGTRELVVGGTPYIILYRVHRQRITINTIWHSSQDK
jgi:addiction module RelE/StbE family toxin